MGCHTPGCSGEHEEGTISHAVLYRKKSIVLHRVPAGICPQCGDVVLAEETSIVLEDLMRRKIARSGRSVFVYES